MGRHFSFQCFLAPKKPLKTSKRPKQRSDKQLEYQLWLEEVARPVVIARDGPGCACPGGCSAPGTDLDHVKGKGAYPSLKRSIANLRLLCRVPCHFNKTIGKPCLHA